MKNKKTPHYTKPARPTDVRKSDLDGLPSDVVAAPVALVTESTNPDSVGIDKKSTAAILGIINDGDKQIAYAVEKELPRITQAVELIVKALRCGGRLFYVGAGTSGRLGVADAAECPPTFGVPSELVQGVIAGGRQAVFKAREGCEDREELGLRDLARRGLTAKDVVVGLSCSGRTPYVAGALKKAKECGAATVAIICNPEGGVCDHADVAIKVVTGPEVVMGSTRMKAGTAEKMVLNMLSTTTMIKLGKVVGNNMVDMQISCSKMVGRAVNIIKNTTGVNEATARKLLDQSGGNVREALEKAKLL